MYIICIHNDKYVYVYVFIRNVCSGWMDGWMDGSMDGWMDGWMDMCAHSNVDGRQKR